MAHVSWLDRNIPGMTRYGAEYAFYRAAMKAQEAYKTPFSARTLRAMREEFTRRLASRSASVDDRLELDGDDNNDVWTRIDPADITKAASQAIMIYGHPALSPNMDSQELNEAFSQYKAEHPQSDANNLPLTTNLYNRYLQDFDAYIGNGEEANIRKRRDIARGDDVTVMLPISPVDPRWQNRETVMLNPRATLYLDISDIERLINTDAPHMGDLVEHTRTSAEISLYSYLPTTGRVEQGKAYSPADKMGLSPLKPYMSAEEYTQAFAQLTADYAGHDDQIMSEKAQDRAREIVHRLDRENPGGYTITPDRGRGQLVMTLKNTGTQVRIMDTQANEAYIGRVYRDGYTVRMTRKTADGYQPVTLDADMVVDMVKLAEGEEITDDHNMIVGHGGTGQYDSYFVSGSDKGIRHPYTQMSYDETQERVNTVMISSQRELPQRTFYRADDPRLVAQAEKDLRGYIDTARETFMGEINISGLVRDFNNHTEEAISGTHTPVFSEYPEVAALQEAYWSVLTGENETLLRPGYAENEYADIDTPDVDIDMTDGPRIEGEPEDIVRTHAALAVDEFIGHYDTHPVMEPGSETLVDKRFNPVRVAQYASEGTGVLRRTEDIVNALRVLPEISAEELLGTDGQTTAVRNRIITFSEPVPDHAWEPHIREQVDDIKKHVEGVIRRNGGDNVTVDIDDKGIIQWSADRYSFSGGKKVKQVNSKASPDEPSITGTIGQIFFKGEHGEVTTTYASGDNHMFVPGYEAYIQSDRPGEVTSFEQRTRLRGYDELLKSSLAATITSDMVSDNSHVGDPTSINNVYKRMYDRRFDVNFLDHAQSFGLPRELAESIIATEARRVRYGNEYRSESTMHAGITAGENDTRRLNDIERTPWVLSGGRNMALLTRESDGYYDPVLTSTGIQQGIVRYLVDSATVDEQGRIIPGDPKDRVTLVKHPMFADIEHDPADRQVMTLMNVLNSSGVAKDTSVAMMTVGGWNMDDGFVISKEFANNNLVQTPEGTRPIRVGDKLSDLHGNKGVVSLIVDREADYDGHELMQNVRDVFYDNPKLDVVMSPFSVVSRRNGGTTVEAGRNTDNLNLGDETYEKALGTMSILITHKDVDSGTTIYDDDAIAQGRGRKASGQLGWSLMSLDATHILGKFYENNSTAVENIREIFYAVGLDMDDDGTMLRTGDVTHGTARERHLFELPEELPLTQARGKRPAGLNRRKIRKDFAELIDNRGGDLELPFELKYPDAAGVSGHGDALAQTENGTWKMPILSSYLRSGRELDDGTATLHDYTKAYQKVYEHAISYMWADEQLKMVVSSDTTTRKRLENEKLRAHIGAQNAFNSVTDDLIDRRFNSKKNMFRDWAMGKKQPDSATAVWTPNPELDIDQIGVSPAMAEALGLNEGDYAAVFRDPQLRAGGFRGMRVAIITEPEITGVSINPAATKSFDGDFDGDSVGIIALHDPQSQKELREKCSVTANLLDPGYRAEDGLRDLSFHTGQDLAMGQNPERKEDFARLRREANELYEACEKGEIDRGEFFDQSHVLMSQLSTWARESFANSYGQTVLNFSMDEKIHRQPIEDFINKGAKGNPKGLAKYEEQRYGYLSEKAQRDRYIESYMATGVKSHGTGVAGAYSQRGVLIARGAAHANRAAENGAVEPHTTAEYMQAITEMTYPVTQAILQAKHDAADAIQRYSNIITTVRSHFRGERLTEDFTHDTQNAAPMTKQEWIDQSRRIYGEKCLNVDIDEKYIRTVADLLEDPALLPEVSAIRSFEDTSVINQYATPLDQCAYTSVVKGGSNFSAAYALADERRNLFEGPMSCYAPQVVQTNMELMKEDTGVARENIQTLAKTDVLVDEHDKHENKKTHTGADFVAPQTVKSDKSADERYTEAEARKEKHRKSFNATALLDSYADTEKTPVNDYEFG